MPMSSAWVAIADAPTIQGSDLPGRRWISALAARWYQNPPPGPTVIHRPCQPEESMAIDAGRIRSPAERAENIGPPRGWAARPSTQERPDPEGGCPLSRTAPPRIDRRAASWNAKDA